MRKPGTTDSPGKPDLTLDLGHYVDGLRPNTYLVDYTKGRFGVRTFIIRESASVRQSAPKHRFRADDSLILNREFREVAEALHVPPETLDRILKTHDPDAGRAPRKAD